MCYKILLFCLVASLLGVTLTSQSCPEVSTIARLKIPKFLGRWYEILRTPYFGEAVTPCYFVEYTRVKGRTLRVDEFYEKSSSERQHWAYYGRIVNGTDPGKLKLKYPWLPIKTRADYWILDTDYTSYTVGYRCLSEFNNYIQVWIMTRDRFPKKSVLDQAKAVVKSNGLVVPLITTDQNDCEY